MPEISTSALDRKFRAWLQGIADAWGQTVEEAASGLADEAIRNRMENYPKVAAAVRADPFDLGAFATATRRCKVMQGQYDSIRFNAFLGSGEAATRAITELAIDFPADRAGGVARIRKFVEVATSLGFRLPNGRPERAGAAQFVSVILSATEPSRFVDYRKERWRKLADAFGYPCPSTGAYGEWMMWSGEFGAALAKTPTYSEFWPTSDRRFTMPLWVISGICWTGLNPRKPEPIPPAIDDLSFPEGRRLARLHFSRERSAALVRAAKAAALVRDPSLACEVCRFSFVKNYGDHGSGYIEAHHTVPVADLKPGTKNRVEDLALVCANCHRMIHAGPRTLDIQELRSILREAHRQTPDRYV